MKIPSPRLFLCAALIRDIIVSKRGMVLIILGIDPGYAIMGYGIIDAEGNRLRVIDYGVTETRSSPKN